jgi:hypothetical protein
MHDHEHHSCGASWQESIVIITTITSIVSIIVEIFEYLLIT